jgi:hypothetical protein
LFVKYIIQNWGKSAGLMLFAVVYTGRICVSVGLDLPLRRKKSDCEHFQSAELQRMLNRKEAVAGG